VEGIHACSEDSRSLIRLVCFLGGHEVPEISIINASRPNLWSATGEHQSISQCGSQIQLFKDENRTVAAIEYLKSQKGVSVQDRKISIEPDIISSITTCSADASDWALEALIVACYVFPQDPSYVADILLVS
jgi:hypothetical protein